MASIMDMLAEVPFEDVDKDESMKEGDATADKAETEMDCEPEKREDLFKVTDDEDENNDLNNVGSFYTEPIVLENKHLTKTKGIKKKSMKVEVTGNNTDTDGDNAAENVTQRDPSLAVEESEESEEEYKDALPGNPDPDGPKYCHCRWGESGVMVECEECNEWYHDECIGLTEEETYNIEKYYCAPCCSANSDLVTRYKEDPVKLRQKILEEIRLEEEGEKKKRKKKRSSKDNDEEFKPNKTKKVARPKTPKTPKPKIHKPKKVARTETKPKATPKRNKALNRSLPSKRSFSDYSDDSDFELDDEGRKKKKEERVAFVICEECGDSFPSNKSLARHFAKLHAERPEIKYPCDECDKSFSSAKALREHEVMHSGVKPFSCMFCGEAFFLMSQLTGHTNSKHLNVRHQCEQCSRSYSNRASLMTHMKKIHGEEGESD